MRIWLTEQVREPEILQESLVGIRWWCVGGALGQASPPASIPSLLSINRHRRTSAPVPAFPGLDRPLLPPPHRRTSGPFPAFTGLDHPPLSPPLPLSISL